MTQATEDYRADVGPATRAAMPLTYATPDRSPRSRGTGAVITLAVLVLTASVLIFLTIAESHWSDPSALWAGAVAVLALAGMGTAMGHFLTRSR